MSTAVPIARVPILPFGMVNAFLIHGDQGTVLVDTGLPGSTKKIKRVLRKAGRSLRDIKLIVVTHAHVDHAGSAAELRDITGVPILAHEDDAKYYRQEATMTFCTTDGFSKLFLKANLIQQPYRAFSPDLLLRGEETFDLSPFGIPGQVRPTSGHTAGSVAVELATGEAVVGDLVASGILIGGIAHKSRAKQPPFEDDSHRVGRELLRLVDAGVQTFHMGHGGPLGAREVARHAQGLLERRA